jgi:hypothetical protein
MHEYFVFKSKRTPENCTINHSPPALDDEQWRVAEGTRMGERYSPSTRLDMDKKHAGMGVPDYINNTLLLPLVSGRFKALLERESGAEIEFLRFTLYNHKGRVASDDCYIANIIGTIDCVDHDKTVARQSHIRPGQFSRIFKLVLDSAKIPSNAKIFRLATKPIILIIRDDLRAVLDQSGITGVQYIPIGEEHLL